MKSDSSEKKEVPGGEKDSDTEDLMGRELWRPRDIAAYFSVTRQRAYEYAKLYRWDPVLKRPYVYRRDDVLKSEEVIKKRREDYNYQPKDKSE